MSKLIKPKKLVEETKTKEIDNFLVHCYEMYNKNRNFCFYTTKMISLFEIKNLLMELNFKIEDDIFSLVAIFISTQIVQDVNDCFFESSREYRSSKITKNMCQEDFCREFDIVLKKFAKDIKELKYCKIQNKIVKKDEDAQPRFPKDYYFSDWKDAQFRETQCLVCYEECSTFVKCCNKSFCIPCLSNLQKTNCPHCNFDHYHYIERHGETGNSFYITK